MTRLVVVVPPETPDVYCELATALAGEPARVIVDRRRDERRHDEGTPRIERRRRERRGRWTPPGRSA